MKKFLTRNNISRIVLSFIFYSIFSFNSLTSAQEQKTVKILIDQNVIPEEGNPTADAIAKRKVLQAFRAKYPYIEVVTNTGLRIEGMGQEVGRLMSIAGDVAPDVISISFRNSDGFIKRGFLYPLDEWINKVPENELNERVKQSVKDVLYRVGSDGKKHWYGFPYDNWVMALVYRKDLFAEAGLDPEKPPKTWDEMMAYSRKITNPEKGIYGLGLMGGTAASWNFYSFLLSAGARAVEEDENGTWKAVFDTPESVEAVYFYARLLQEKFVKNGKTIYGAAVRDENIWRMWKDEKIGMTYNYLSDQLMQNVNPEQVGIAPVPKGPTGIRGSEINCGILCVFGGVKNPQVRDAAWKFVEFWGSPEAIKIRTQVLIENGFGHLVNPGYLRKHGHTEYLKYVPKGWEETFKEALANGVPEPYGTNCQVVYDYMTKPLDISIVEDLGNKPPSEALPRIQKILNEAVIETNEKMIGIVPKDKMSYRRKVATAVGVIIAFAFCWAFWYLRKIFTPSSVKVRWGFKKYWIAYLILLPALVFEILWHYIPTFSGAIIAFLDYNVMGGSKWVGIDNFANVLFDKTFWETLWHSLYFSGLYILIGFLSPIFLALLLHEVPKGKVFFRVIYYLPAVISGLVVIFLWKNFYDPSAGGLLNKILSIVWTSISPNEFVPQRWLQDPKWAMLCTIIPIVWSSMGPACLIYLAALKTVPDDLYEAADIDGANLWHKIMHITYPTIKPLVLITFIGAFVNTFKMSNNYILAMTGGGPAGATKVLPLEIFFNAFLYLKFGIATAMAWLLGFILLGFTVYQMKRLSRMQFKASGRG
ncbi:MAG: hypothetical protein A2252_06920 [Elusimicrobia bacterium RIFOXYA2_FULL_39_19]|nr:MAG: hypothetical protein A2252_06920 [Elusimicrobia bacterium RIFOXYA2_FULL_39_19]